MTTEKEIRTVKEIKDMIHRLWKVEEAAPQHLKETYSGASEVLEWVLRQREEDDVIVFG